MNWVKSSRSESAGTCVEVAVAGAEVVVRNSRDPLGAHVRFTLAEWGAFVAGAAAGEFAPERLIAPG